MTAESPPPVYALDFDGVICDSCGESSAAGWLAAVKQWPEHFSGATEQERAIVMEQMRVVRPVVETGFENVLLVRLLLDALRSGQSERVIETLMESWGTRLCEEYTNSVEWGSLGREYLIDFFGDVRDTWMNEDLDAWLGENSLYGEVAEALNNIAAPDDMFIVTTKQGRFASALLNRLGDVDVPEDSDRMYALGSGPKIETLKLIQEQYPGRALVFVEDRLATLQKVINTPGLERWNLFLVDWGYNTPAERDLARTDPACAARITVVDLPTFYTLLKTPSDLGLM